MKGDYSRIPFNDTKKKQHYRKAYLQQGRVLLDSDLNENTDLLQYQTKTLAKDVACLCGSPNNGFRIGKGLLLAPVDSKKGWSLEFNGGNTSEPTISFEPSDIFEGKGSLHVKDAIKAIFTSQKPIDLSRHRWIRLGLKGKGNTVPENMPVKLCLESNGNIATVDKDKEISMENGFTFFNYSFKNINPQDFKDIDKITSVEFSGFDNKPEENMYLFKWNKILANDNQELIDFLKLKYRTEWVKAEQVKISNDNKTIRLEDGKNYLLLNLNDEKTRVSLEVNDIRLDEFAAINDKEELKVYLSKNYLIGVVECSPPMFTLDTIQSDWSYEEPTPKVGADVSIVSANGEGSTIEAKGIIKLTKEFSAPVDFSNYTTIEFSLKRIGSSTSIEFYIIDMDKNEGAWEIRDFSDADLKKHTISLKDQNPEGKINMKSVIEYGFRQLSPSDTYNFGRILYEINPNNNFVISGSDMLSGETGRLYVNGELYEKEDIETYLNQKEYPYPPPIDPPKSGFRKDLVYAEVWERHITHIEDQQLRETALGGPDTCNRIKAVVQVKVKQGAESLPEDLMLTGGGRLSTTIARSSLTVKSCEMSSESEYTGWDNRLYRVEKYYTGKPAFVPSHTWMPTIKTPPLFKWSRNNASTTSPIVQNVEKDANFVVVKDSRLFKKGDIIEITDDLGELSGIYEELRIITDIDPDENRLFWKKDLQSVARQSGPLSYVGGLSRFYIAEGTETTHPKVIKWDGVKSVSSESLELEDGVKIRFSGSDMRKGDYWTFTARATTHEVERLENEPPHGIIRHYCPLALIHWNGSKIERIEDIRGRFKPLGELKAADIAFDCKNSAVLADNVQQAIENLQIKLDYGTNLDLIAGSLTIRGSELDRTHWPKLTCSKREDGVKHGDICFLTGSGPEAEKMRILEEGHVGIGTMSPNIYATDEKGKLLKDEKGTALKWDKVLDIYSCLNAKLSIRTDGIDARVQVQEESDKVKGKVWEDVPDGMIVGTKSPHKLSLVTNKKARMVIDENGNVGIGTTGPLDDKLNLEGDLRGAFIKTRVFPPDDSTQGLTGFALDSRELGGSTHTWRICTAPVGGSLVVPGNSLTFLEYGLNPTQVGNQSLVLQAYTGNVGIGLSDPKAKLHVDATDRPTIMAQGNFGGLISGSGGGHGVFGTNIYMDFNNQLKTAGTHTANYGYAGMHASWGNIHFYAAGGNTTESGSIDPTSRMFIRGSDGFVGIGKDPVEKLDIDGNLRIGGSHTYLAGCTNENGPNTYIGTHHVMAHDSTEAIRFSTMQYDSDYTKHVTISEGWEFHSENIYATQIFTNNAKHFLINHPLYPDTHELLHSTLEGPEIAVFYRGEAHLSNGETIITLPEYFEALTRKVNRTVLLTSKFEENIKVSMLAASEVKNGKFTVKMIDSNNPSQKFYWEVKAIRADVGVLEVERKKNSTK